MSTPLQVLMIEDNENDAFFATRELRRAGYDVDATRVDTTQALRDALPDRPWDLILCDFTLPGFGGAEALRIAKELRPHVPFIFVSGTIGEEAVAEAMRSGAQDYVMKDRLTRLVPAVARELREAAARHEARLADRWMRESEHKYRQLFDALHEAVFVIDERSGRVLDTNRQAETLLDRTRAEIVGASHTTLFVSPVGAHVLDELRALAADRARSGCVAHLLRRSGPPLPAHASASPIEFHGRAFLLVLMHPNAEPRDSAAADTKTAEAIIAAVACWPDEAVRALVERLSRLRRLEPSPGVSSQSLV